MKKLGARRYVERTFCSLADIAHSVGFDAGTPADRVAEYLEEYAARTHGVTLIYAQEVAEDLLAKLADPRVLQEEWFRYNRNGGDHLRYKRSETIPPAEPGHPSISPGGVVPFPGHLSAPLRESALRILPGIQLLCPRGSQRRTLRNALRQRVNKKFFLRIF